MVDKRFGFFVNHDLAGYEVPVHADIPHQDVIFLDETDPMSSPMKAKGVGELGICGVGAAIANAVYNATGVRVRDYPITLDKLIDRAARDRLTTLTEKGSAEFDGALPGRTQQFTGEDPRPAVRGRVERQECLEPGPFDASGWLKASPARCSRRDGPP